MFLNGLLDTRKNLGFTGLSCNDFEDFGGGLCKESIISRDPVSIVLYTRPGSSIKWSTPNYNWQTTPFKMGVVFPKISYKIIDPVSSSPRRKTLNILCYNSATGSICLIQTEREHQNYQLIFMVLW